MTKIMKVSEARNNIFKLMAETSRTHNPIIISSNKNDAVLMSLADYKAIEETLYLNSIPNLAKSLIKASKDDDSKFSSNIQW